MPEQFRSAELKNSPRSQSDTCQMGFDTRECRGTEVPRGTLPPAWEVRVPSRPTHSIRIEGQPGMFLGWTPVKQVNWKKQSKGNSRKYWFIQTNGKSERSCVSTSHHQIWPARAGPATMDMTHDKMLTNQK